MEHILSVIHLERTIYKKPFVLNNEHKRQIELITYNKKLKSSASTNESAESSQKLSLSIIEFESILRFQILNFIKQEKRNEFGIPFLLSCNELRNLMNDNVIFFK